MKETFEDNIGLLIHDVARLLRVLYDRQMASIGLTRSQWWLLTYLYFKDGINQSELANLMDMEKAPLSRLLDRMETKEIGRAHVRTPVTEKSRMPSSA